VTNKIVIGVALAGCLFFSGISPSLGAADSKLPARLPSGVLTALSDEEADFCDPRSHTLEKEYGGKLFDCHQTFRASLSSRELVLTTSGQIGFLVSINLYGYCGSGGCRIDLYLKQEDGTFIEVYERQGGLGEFRVLKTSTHNHYDIEYTGTASGEKLKERLRLRWNNVSTDYTETVESER
jgi:hypothetical protein